MRLLGSQVDDINRIVREYVGDGSRAYLFGSRVDDLARGGDVDLLVETPKAVPLMTQVRLKMAIESAIRLPVDLIVRRRDKPPTAFHKIAQAQAIPLTKAL